MKNILECLYYGKIYPAEHTAPRNAEYLALNKVISEERTALKQLLSEEDGKRLVRWEEMCTHANSLEEMDTFIYGFRLGALLMTEIFAGEDITRE